MSTPPLSDPSPTRARHERPPGATRPGAPAPLAQQSQQPAPADGPRSSRPVLHEPRSGPFRLIVSGTSTVALALLTNVAINVLTDVWNISPLGQGLNSLLATGLVVLVVATPALTTMFREWQRRRRPRLPHELGLVTPDTPIRPAWYRPPQDLRDRDESVRQGVELLLRHGATAVVGAPGTGSSAVAGAVVHELLRTDAVHAADVAPFDLRGWAWEPDSALTLACHLLPTFGLTAPVTEEELPHAAERLRQVLVRDHVLLVLDNLAEPSQIDWLVRVLAAGPSHPMLLVAGRAGLLEAFDHKEHVELHPLGDDALRTIWSDRMKRAGRPVPRSPDDGWLDAVLPYCAGLPKAVHDLAREFTRPGAPWTPDELVQALSRTSGAGAPAPGLPTVWTAILDRTRDSLSRRGKLLLGTLAELSVTELTVEAIEAVSGSLDELIQLLEHDEESQPAESPDTPPDPVAELRGRRLIRETASGRYRLPAEIRSVVRTPAPSRESLAGGLVARQALVRYYAGLARTWMLGLDTPQDAAAAARWFHTTEPLLRALLSGLAARTPYTGDAENTAATEGATEAATEDENATITTGTRLVDDLCVLTDALDRWRSRTSRPTPTDEPPLTFLTILRQARRPDLEQLATIRAATGLREAGRLTDAKDALSQAAATPYPFWHRPPRRRGWRRNYATALRARRHHEAALHHIALAGSSDDPTDASENLRRAEGELQLAWGALPAKDIAGEVTTLLTMAQVFLHQGVPDRALDRLDLAETRATEGEDPNGLAQVIELRGVAAWMQGRSSAAVVLWQRALTEFSRLADQQGQARCLQHLGSAVLVAPELTGLVLEERRRPLDEVSAIQHAQAWLERSQRLRIGPASAVAAHYLELARARALPRDDAAPPAMAEELPAESGPVRTKPVGVLARLLAVFGRGTR